MDLLHQPLLKRCLALTGAFETCQPAPECFSGLTGNFDGMGFSLGALQWNLGQKTLQPMLSEMLSDQADVMAAIFGAGLGAVKYMLALPRAAQVKWAQSIQNSTHFTINEPWQSRFIALGQTAEFQQIQIAHAGLVHQDALELCRRFGLVSERGLALMFDIRVQNGGIANAVESKIRADFLSIRSSPAALDPMTTELARLKSIANRRADAANPKFIEDVRTRKLTIASGTGKVHGVEYNLETQFGIRLLPDQLGCGGSGEPKTLS